MTCERRSSTALGSHFAWIRIPTDPAIGRSVSSRVALYRVRQRLAHLPPGGGKGKDPERAGARACRGDRGGKRRPLRMCSAGELIRVGDRVVWSVAVSCGQCFFCTHDLPQSACRFASGHEPITPQCGPVGGLTTHCHLLKGTAIVKVPLSCRRSCGTGGRATATVMLRAAA